MGRISGEAFTLYVALGAAPPVFSKKTCRLRRLLSETAFGRRFLLLLTLNRGMIPILGAPFFRRDSLQPFEGKGWLLAMLASYAAVRGSGAAYRALALESLSALFFLRKRLRKQG